jgi:hypothetical protein
VITRMVRHISFFVDYVPGLTIFLMVVVSFASPSPCEGARLSRFLTSQDLADRLILDQNGQPVQVPTVDDRHPELAKGSTPTYLAIPLQGGEHLPASIPTLDTGSQQGENPVGPLNFDSLVKTNLDAILAKSRLAIVDTSTQNYLVEFLPRRALSSLSVEKTAGGATNPVNALSNLLLTGSNQLAKLNQSGMNELEKLLHISSKTSTLTPSLNLEAQVFNGDVMPAAIPEPAAWILFAGLIAGTAARRVSRPTSMTRRVKHCWYRLTWHRR